MMVISRKRLLVISLPQQNSSETSILLPFIDCQMEKNVSKYSMNACSTLKCKKKQEHNDFIYRFFFLFSLSLNRKL